jgi:hypothetical protein
VHNLERVDDCCTWKLFLAIIGLIVLSNQTGKLEIFNFINLQMINLLIYIVN